MAIKIGNKVKVEYTGSFENGEVFDSTEKHSGEALELVVGAGMLVPGFEKAVEGMSVGEEKEVTLTPEEAYGMPNAQAVQKVPKGNFPDEAKVGMMIGVQTPMGQIPALIKEIGETEVTLDMNHPLAGKTLIFKIKIVSFEEGDFLAEMNNHSCGCASGECDSEESSSCSEEKGESSCCGC